MVNLFEGCIRRSYNLFLEMKCITAVAKNKSLDLETLDSLDEDKMRCHILDCLVALLRVQKRKKKLEIRHQHECTKRRIFALAVSAIIDDKELEGSDHILSSLIVSFPDTAKMTDGRSWLPLHIAVALGNKVNSDDVKMLYSADPLAMRRYNVVLNSSEAGYLPGHILCMWKYPNISLIRYLSMRDLKAFCMLNFPRYGGNEIGNNCLQLAAKYSENVELLMILLQIDHSMTKANARSVIHGASFKFYDIIIIRSTNVIILFMVCFVTQLSTFI